VVPATARDTPGGDLCPQKGPVVPVYGSQSDKEPPRAVDAHRGLCRPLRDETGCAARL